MTDPSAQTMNDRPRLGFGGVVAAASSLVMLVSFGIYVTYGLFLNPLVAEFGWSRAAISGAYSVSSVMQGIVGILAGVWTDKVGARVVVTLSGVLFGAGCILMYQVSSLWGLYLCFGVLVGMGMGGLWVPPLSTVARWFTKRRSLATGIVLAGMTVGQVIAPPIISRLIVALGWRLAFLIPGIVALAVILVGAQFLKRRPPVRSSSVPKEDSSESGVHDDGFSCGEALHTRQFWLVSAAFLFVGVAVFGPLIHLVPYAIEAGLSEVNAANVLAVAGAVGIPGSFLLGGLLGDAIGNRKTFMAGLVLVVIALALLAPAAEPWLFYLCAIILGTGMSGLAATESPLVAELFGLRSHASIYAAAGVGYTGGIALGPFLFGSIFDRTGNYDPAFYLAVGVAIAALMLVAALKPARKAAPEEMT